MPIEMIQRYLGNKTVLTREIVDLIGSVAEPGDLVFDAFSGSLAVSRAVKNAGYRVACNDINHFSWLYARAYLSTSELPWPEGPWRRNRTSKLSAWREVLDDLIAAYDDSIPASARRTDIFEHYTEEGSRSAFVSSRGATGRRRFFSPDNARAIDRALTRIRYWHSADLIDEQTRCLISASLLSGVEKVSNTQGTYHDFPRDFYDPRALRPISLLTPDEEAFRGPPAELIGKAEDTLEFCPVVPRHRVMYVDPPYNFRQYTAYYFMLNLLSMYAEIEDLDSYFEKIAFVRGQNMDHDFQSTFCSKSQFLPSLRRLIGQSNSDFVVLSYFNGRNHWGNFKSDNDLVGRPLVEDLLSSGLFVEGSLRCTPVVRMNYQSYGGYKSKPIDEFLFLVERCRTQHSSDCQESSRWIGEAMA